MRIRKGKIEIELRKFLIEVIKQQFPNISSETVYRNFY